MTKSTSISGGARWLAVKKEAKHYHLDWTTLSDPGARFENLVACHLLKWCYCQQDSKGVNMELRYFRDVDLITRDDIRVCSAYYFLNSFN